ncbi:hypothetical protein [Anaerocolumna chitinilytica]|uniref:Uncharacterized protein n=1 Tax=Anaerocolumna chitinilytica TaxID=1727145 RepID=A0A7I8DUH6_9FIRM|nr:hypothetical protein [Anaerocolumna chitinilytica]BCK00736.1 hypothetical protein bsdcttw_37760 [Anaerocolumna chitinilytica]
MESAFYGYYFISTDCLSNKWKTYEIERFLLAYGGFEQEGNGSFKHKSVFCTIHLMNVKSYTSWNSNDYNNVETNYINILTSKKPPKEIKNFFGKLEIFLGWHIREEIDDIIY